MTAPLNHWYLIAYDVREPKRLRQVHYYLRKRALAVQKSVFILQTDPAGLTETLAGLSERVLERDDDLRLYAIPGPGALWAAGRQAANLGGLYGASAGADASPHPGRLRRWVGGLFCRDHARDHARDNAGPHTPDYTRHQRGEAA
jgi:CRISPR-associated protein Cas2